MKITTVFLFAACMHVSSSTRSQTVTFTGKDVPLSKVFAVVKQQTGYVFFYNKTILRDGASINVQAKDQPLEAFLKVVLQGQLLDYTIEDKVIIISRKLVDELPDIPPVTVSGRITDDRGVPLPGVSVKVKVFPQRRYHQFRWVFGISGHT